MIEGMSAGNNKNTKHCYAINMKPVLDLSEPLPPVEQKGELDGSIPTDCYKLTYDSTANTVTLQTSRGPVVYNHPKLDRLGDDLFWWVFSLQDSGMEQFGLPAEIMLKEVENSVENIV